MKKILVTGGTVFVSRFVADYFSKRGNEVYVLNRGSREQVPGVKLIQADRHDLRDKLSGYDFDAVLDITAYTRADVEDLVKALGKIKDYVFISSSAVYPETLSQPFREEQKCGSNSIWGIYGVNKLEAEEFLRNAVPQAYILRPPYLYGPMQNVYREAFVFECAEQGRPFYIPGNGDMKLQFLHVEDLCRFIELLLERKPENRVFNVGNPEAVTVRQWVQMCYDTVGVPLQMVSVQGHLQRGFFCFHDYDYYLDVSRQRVLMPEVKPLAEGLSESYAWFQAHRESVLRRPYMEYADQHFGQ